MTDTLADDLLRGLKRSARFSMVMIRPRDGAFITYAISSPSGRSMVPRFFTRSSLSCALTR
jgi:hypothetical protein